MVQFNLLKKEVSYKIVYYGPSGSGKTANLQFLDQQMHRKKKLAPIAMGKNSDLVFDFLPVDAGVVYGLTTHLKLFAVPGGSEFKEMRRLILQDTDGIVVVCDSQNLGANTSAIKDLEENLAEQGKNFTKIAVVVQWNKRDLSNVLSLKQLQQIVPDNTPEFTAVATTGEGTFITLETLTNMLVERNLESYPTGCRPLTKEQKQRLALPRIGKEGMSPETKLVLGETKTSLVPSGMKKGDSPEDEALVIEEFPRVSSAGEVVLLKLKGKIDAKSAQAFKKKVQEQYLQGESIRLILDLEQIDYIHSTAFGMLIEIANKAKLMNGGIRLVHVQEKNRVFFEMMCVENVLPIAESEEQALESFPAAPKEEEPSLLQPKSMAPSVRRRTKDLMASLTGTQNIRLSEFVAKKSTTGKLFISYSREDVKLAEQLEEDLKSKNYEVWRDRSRFTPGVKWSQAVSKPLGETNIVLLLWTENSYNDEWVRYEWVTAVALKKKIVPCPTKIKLRLPLPLQSLKRVFLEDYNKGVTILAQECKYSTTTTIVGSMLPDFSYLPWPANPNFQRTGMDLLEILHKLLESHVVAIHPAPGVPSAGIGKSQVAVEFAYRFGFAFDGVLWINAANDWEREFARVAREIDITSVTARDTDHTAQLLHRLLKHIQRYPNTLVIMDRVADPKELTREISPGFAPLTCGCYLLCTTGGDLPPDMASVELDSLSEEEAYELFTRLKQVKESEQAAAKDLCQLVQGFPFALELSAIFLREHPDLSLASFVESLRTPPAGGLSSAEAAFRAILQKVYGSITDHYARSIFEVAGQLPPGRSFSYDTAAMLIGIDSSADQLVKAIEHLASLGLITKLPQRSLVLHPALYPFAYGLHLPEKKDNFRSNAAQRLFTNYRSLFILERECQKRDIDEVLQDLRMAYEWSEDPQISELITAVAKERHILQNMIYRPCAIVQQLYSRLRGERKLENYLEQILVSIVSSSHRWPKNTVWLKRVNFCPRTVSDRCEYLMSACFSPSGKTVAGGSNNTLALWSADTGDVVRVLVQNLAGAKNVRYSPKGNRLLVSSLANLELWDLDSYEKVWETQAHSDWIVATAISGENKAVLSAGKDREIKLWDGASGRLLGTFPNSGDIIRSLSFSHDDSKFAAGGDDATVALWDLKTNKKLLTLKGHFKPVQSVCFSANGQYILSGGRDGLVKLWENGTGRDLYTFAEHDGEITDIAVSQNSAYMLLAAADRSLNLWSLEKRKLLQRFNTDCPVVQCRFSPDNKEIWACDGQQPPEIYKFQIVETR